MCTAVTYKTKDFYFGRTLDYEFSYGEEITVTPRNYIFDFRHIGQLKSHYAIIGMAFVSEGYPLYYDAINEKSLEMAGLNFVGNAAQLYLSSLPVIVKQPHRQSTALSLRYMSLLSHTICLNTGV